MKVIQTKNYQDMSEKAAQFILEKIKSKPDFQLGLATGGTPVTTYQNLIQDHQTNQTSYQLVTTFNLDEYIGLSNEDPNSYHYYMNKHLFSEIDIPADQTFIPNGLAEDLERECIEYDALISKYNGIDLQILGLGHNGHIGFNEPGTPFDKQTHIVTLADSTVEANARFFDSIEDVPTQAITMGIGSIMKSKEILLLVSGREKHEALQKLLHDEVNELFPASILQRHKNVTIIADEDAIIGKDMMQSKSAYR
ncbi:glucosamine-6-phosphate deaminase [Gracilibacillus caseinilyticus]|uniref:Glucosamine-6-phosphate deaminase n=1 Tax=Gracilibacillus caseinilyticus TaxID=2932256 RepID=A0ABY4ESJ8_9BACI|nr:glucosamine-6-phosphate deaminase [Gracilibacillus caseinilyticus]UOQ46712.1 glucosamine-6-phosphate deaminase [Gracilibacillus caseinilyticus]